MGSASVAAHGTVYDASILPVLVADRAGELVGLFTYHVTDTGMEIVTFDAARTLKPTIPTVGDHGIELHDN